MSNIFIPSYGKAGKITTHKLFPNAGSRLIVCPDKQGIEYKKCYENVKTIPDKMDGSGGKKRNAIIELFAKENDIIWILDDDVSEIKHLRNGDKLHGDELLEFMESAEIMMRDDKRISMFGFTSMSNDLYYKEYLPFNFIKPVYYFVALKKMDFRYDEVMRWGADVDYCLRVLQAGFWILRDNRYYPVHHEDTKGDSEGGTGLTYDERQVEFDNLQKKWGSGIIKKRRDGTVMPINPPIKGV